MTTNAVVPANVTYDAASRIATVVPVARLAAARPYRVEATSGVRDVAGNPAVLTTLAFTSGTVSFYDTDGHAFQEAVEWLVAEGITGGCRAEYFCPNDVVTRQQMASFLARALDLAGPADDAFTDDDGNPHETDINRVAAAGITGGCAPSRFCPTTVVTRQQMASFLARILDLPASDEDLFTDDDSSPHQADINRLAAAGITGGCAPGRFCPTAPVTRGQMAAFLQRAFGD